MLKNISLILSSTFFIIKELYKLTNVYKERPEVI